MHTTLFLSFSRLVFYLLLESVIAISIHLNTLIFFPMTSGTEFEK